MKKALLISFALTCCIFSGINKSCAVNWGYNYVDGGNFYSDVTIPLDAGKAINSNEENFIPISNVSKNSTIEEQVLKKGTSSRTDILGLVEVGDAGILKAAKEGKVNKIHYIEVTKEKLYIPLGFIPVYFDRFITNVYGE